MNGHCSYWLINLTSDDLFDYLSNGTYRQVVLKMIFLVKMPNGFESNGTFGQVKQTKMTTYLLIYLSMYLLW